MAKKTGRKRTTSKEHLHRTKKNVRVLELAKRCFSLTTILTCPYLASFVLPSRWTNNSCAPRCTNLSIWCCKVCRTAVHCDAGLLDSSSATIFYAIASPQRLAFQPPHPFKLKLKTPGWTTHTAYEKSWTIMALLACSMTFARRVLRPCVALKFSPVAIPENSSYMLSLTYLIIGVHEKGQIRRHFKFFPVWYSQNSNWPL